KPKPNAQHPTPNAKSATRARHLTHVVAHDHDRAVRKSSPRTPRSASAGALHRNPAFSSGIEHLVSITDMPPPLTYASYLDLEELLSLQKTRSTPPEHDETLFIIIHQTYELWFKQLLHEFEKIKRDFSASDLFGAIHTFKRVRTIMKVLVAQIDILETMTPTSFSSFRDRLETASGFQSIQFREVEFA